jgi:hypothetical protein
MKRFKRQTARGIVWVAMVLTLGPVEGRAQVVIPDEVLCSDCGIETELLVRLGSDDSTAEDLLPGVPRTVVRDAEGRYWLVYTMHAPMVFDSTGAFLATVGRLGEGPGELQYPHSATPAGDSVVVFDGAGRGVVFGSDLAPTRTLRLGTVVHRAAALEWPGRVLIDGAIATPDRAGLPLHLVDMSETDTRILRSMTLDRGELRPGAPPNPALSFAPPAMGSVWGVDRLRYRLSRWDSQGVAHDILLREPDWFPGVSSGLPGGEDSPPTPLVQAITEDSSGRLWVFSRVASPSWRDAWRTVVQEHGPLPERGEVSSHILPPPHALYETIVEVIDPTRRAVLTRDRSDHFVVTTVDEDVVAYSETDQGAIILEVLRFRVVPDP